MPYNWPIRASNTSHILRYCNIIVYILYYLQQTKISRWEEPDFFLEIYFYMNKTLHRHWRMGQVLILKQDELQLLANFKKILYMGFRATLNFRKFKIALNPMYRIVLNFAKSFILSCLSQFYNKKKIHLAVFEI